MRKKGRSGKVAIALILSGVVCVVVLPLTLGNQDRAQDIYLAGFLALALFFAFVGKRMHRDWLSPIVLMSIGWMVPVFLHSLQLSGYYLSPFTLQTWTVVAETLVFFDLGVLLAVALGGRKLTASPNPDKSRKEVQTAWNRWVLYAYFGIGFAAWLYTVIQRGGRSGIVPGIVLFSDRPDELRWEPPPPIIGQFPILLLVVIVVSIVWWTDQGLKNRKILIPLCAVAVAVFVLDTARSNLFQAVIVGALYWLLRRGRLPKMAWATLVGGCFIFFSTVSGQRMGADRRMYDLAERVDLPARLAYPYIYLSAPLTSLQLNLESGRHVFDGGGVRTFAPILSWLQIYKPPQRFNYLSFWPGGISTYQSDLYIDFGTTGLILGSFAYGVICGWLYRRWRIRRSAGSAASYAVVATAVIASGLVNWFNSPSSWFLLLLIPPTLWTTGFLGARRPVARSTVDAVGWMANGRNKDRSRGLIPG